MPKLVCDVCGKEILDGEMIYTIATDVDAGIGRHSRCKEARDAEIKKGLDGSLAKLHSAASRIRGILDRRK